MTVNSHFPQLFCSSHPGYYRSLILVRTTDPHYSGDPRYDPHKDREKRGESESRQCNDHSDIHSDYLQNKFILFTIRFPVFYPARQFSLHSAVLPLREPSVPSRVPLRHPAQRQAS